MWKFKILLICLASIIIVNATECEDCQNEPQSEEHFVAVHVNQMNIVLINPDSPLIEEIVRPFLSSKFSFLYAINATREIVNGFKYEIIFTMLSTENGIEIYCLMDVLEKPWLISNYKKFRKMTYNNCSLENPLDEEDRMRFQYEINPTFINQRTEMNDDDISDMEDQIITERVVATTNSITSSSSDDVTLDPSSKTLLDGFFNTNNFFPQTTSTTTIKPLSLDLLDEMFGVRKIENSQSQPSTVTTDNADELQQRTQENEKNSDNQEDRENDTALKGLEIEIKKTFSELFQTNSDFRMNIIALINRKDDLTAQKNYNYVVNILASKLKDKIESYNERRFKDEQTQNNYQQINTNRTKRSYFFDSQNSFPSHKRAARQIGVPGGISPVENFEDVKIYVQEAIDEINDNEDPDYILKHIVEATQQVVAGMSYKIKAVFSRDGSDIECDFDVWEQAWIKDGRKVSVSCKNDKKYKLTQSPSNQRVKRDNTLERVLGLPSNTDDHDDLIKILSEHLKRLDTGSDAQFELVKLEKVTQQVVAGIKYKATGIFKIGNEEKKCVIDVWHRSWIKGDEGTQLSADCDKGATTFKTKSSRKRRSVHHHTHNRHNRQSVSDHFDDHHHHTDRHHHQYSATEEMKEIKSEILFNNFITKYNRKYANELEHKMRMRIFKKNLHKIEMLNKHEQGTAKYGITEFADLTEKEYLHKTGLRVRERHENELENPIAHIPEVEDLPTEFDWRDKSAVTSVKNQGNCGSCWSFSVTGNIEGLHAIKTGKLEAYSEQELLDCDTTDNACNGGYMDDAFKAIEKIGGLELEDEYPYQARKQKKCLFNATMSHVKVKGVVDLPKGDEIAMQKFLVSTGPISIGINANAMQFYRGGVSHPWKVLCRKSNLDHGVLIVGYGIKEYPMFNKTLPYWTIKNSWGPKWGEQGYYRVYRGDNSCGVAEMASSAVLE
ncbi:hypothetical protein PVAND_004407 [Polypedilum vanderplanki]|uniref:Cysteine proteinase n=1 Tax=Polypedilum vanderplanki TaxID=319348 RepID=A0A9J6BX20_POLVA|nr:hypothetical protein PVAND_004407 [Polypedilum vanderplanki]